MDTKEKIVQCATKLFLTKGYKQTSLNEIAESAGITKGGIYHYFKDKNELFAEMATFFKSRYESLLVKMESEKSLRDLLKNYFKHMYQLEMSMAEFLELSITDVNLFPQFQARFILDAIENGPKDIDFNLHGKKIYELLKKKVSLAKETGEILDNIDPDELSMEIMAIFDGYTVLRRSRMNTNAYEYGNRHIQRLWSRIKK